MNCHRQREQEEKVIDIKKRISELKHTLEKIEKYLSNAPEGGLKIQNRCGKTYYYHQYKNIETGLYVKTYIDRKSEQLARRLAQKGYYAKVKPLIEKELQALETFAQAKNDEEIDNVYDMLQQERRQLVVPIRVTVKEKLRIWKAESYEPYQKYQENLKYETDNGELVRSKSEVIIANTLAKYSDHLLYKYERPLEVIIDGHKQIFHPDFTIINVHTGKITYWEHAGRMDDVQYANSFVQKMNIYMKNGLFQGEDVIVTYETADCPVNIHGVKMVVKRLAGKDDLC